MSTHPIRMRYAGTGLSHFTFRPGVTSRDKRPVALPAGRRGQVVTNHDKRPGYNKGATKPWPFDQGFSARSKGFAPPTF
jgi:hypothetical protein